MFYGPNVEYMFFGPNVEYMFLGPNVEYMFFDTKKKKKSLTSVKLGKLVLQAFNLNINGGVQ